MRTVSCRSTTLIKVGIAAIIVIVFVILYSNKNSGNGLGLSGRGTKLRYANSKPALLRPRSDSGVGETGKAVRLLDLTASESKEQEESIQVFAVNQFVSERISLHRTIKDARHPLCKNRSPFNYASLPTASVIIAFYNEGWTTLLRTIYSVLHSSPDVLLKEIIMVDDFSDKEYLKKPLEEYFLSHPDFARKVRLIRTTKREGLVRARLLGALHSEGEVLTFLDCHCECVDGWLEPLLERIDEDESVIAIPVIDTIDWNSFEYYYGGHEPQIGGFDWRLTFQWHLIPNTERLRRKSPVDPIRSPTMAGGLFAVSKKYFSHIGTYDSGMEVWGGENLELSFRTWMCGGMLETIPCSHVGHVFPKQAPYPRPKFLLNTVRAAEVWMDDYKRHFYIRNPPAKLENYGDISSRIELRNKLSCKSFEWYLQTIYPDLHVPDDRPGYFGALHNRGLTSYCLDYAPPQHNPTGAKVGMYSCHGQGGNQFFEYTSNNEIRFNSEKEMCMTVVKSDNTMTMLDCSNAPENIPDTQLWNQEGELFKSQVSGDLCLEASMSREGSPEVNVRPCNSENKYQQWYWIE